LTTDRGAVATCGGGAIDEVEAEQALIQPHLKAKAPGAGKILLPKFDVEDPIGGAAADGGKDAEAAIERVKIVPVGKHCGTVDDRDKEAGVAVGRRKLRRERNESI